MVSLRKIGKMVEGILEKDEQTRNSDSMLYLRVLGIFCDHRQIDMDNLLAVDFLLHQKALGFPPFESVRRARQKVQRKRPDLAPCKEVQEIREAQEEAYLEMARSE